MVKSSNVGQPALSRRELLRRSIATAASAYLAAICGRSQNAASQPAAGTARPSTTQPASAAASQPTTQPTGLITPPWWLAADGHRARIVEVRGDAVIADGGCNETVLADMLKTAIEVFAHEHSLATAWRKLLGDAKHIAIKFNRVGADVLSTNGVFARALVETLARAGYPPKSCTLIEVPAGVVEGVNAHEPDHGWGTPIPVGGNQEPLAKYLYDCDALIDVPLLKTHQIAGMSGALKNLSHALIRHPARYHANHCSPYVHQVVGNPAVSSRLRLTIVNALRTVVRNGPDARAEDVIGHGAVYVGRDPVALDTIGLELLQAQRRQLGETKLLAVPYLDAARVAGLGRGRMHELDFIPVSHSS
jgi:hypothetical protein